MFIVHKAEKWDQPTLPSGAEWVSKPVRPSVLREDALQCRKAEALTHVTVCGV